MARLMAVEHTAWNDHDHAQQQDGGEFDGAVKIMGKDDRPMDPRELFVRVRARLKAAVGEDVFNSWFARLELEEFVEDLAHLSVPTRFLCSWIQSNYAEKILDAFKAETQSLTRLHFTVRVNGQARPRIAQHAEPVHHVERAEVATPTLTRTTREPAMAQRGDALSGSVLDPKMTFDDFVVGSPNEIALGVARQV